MDWRAYESEFLSSFREGKEGFLERELDLEFEAQISFFFEMSPIQDAFRFRARHLGRKMAVLLIDEEGNLERENLSKFIGRLEEGIYPLGPRREGDSMLYEHLLFCLKKLRDEKSVWNAILKFSPPLSSKRAEEVVKETLWPESIRVLQTFHIRRAALAAWLTLLRQTTGSCFATAPGILIQKKPIQFFKDLDEILSTGQLKRVFGSKEYAVPMCPSLGLGELTFPLSSKEQLAFSPGLIVALSAAKFFRMEGPLISKVEPLERALEDLEEIANPEQILRDLTLKKEGLTKEDVADEEYLAKIQMGPSIAREGAVFYQRPTPRGQKVADWRKNFNVACMTFQALTDCALLRVWEYTIASFCDVKTDFAKWNLYISLGMHTDHEGGIADFLYRTIDRKLKMANEEIMKFQNLYNSAIYVVRSVESFLPGAGEAQRYELQARLSVAIHEAELALNERDRYARQAQAMAGFFSDLLKYFDEKLQEYFQEVFDPSISERGGDLFEDTPAGFRLLYKHGRSDASAWELIYDEKGYIRSLRSFFEAVEGGIQIPEGLGESFVSEVMTELIQYIQEKEFLERAKRRSESIGRKTPWAYVSGGTMKNLVEAYWERSEPLTSSPFFPKNAMNLLSLLSKETKRENLLIQSPTHAFILRLDLMPENAERKAEENRAAVKNWRCDEEIQEYICHSLSQKLRSSEKALFLHLLRQKPVAASPMQLREILIDALKTVRQESDASLFIDSHLYEYLFLLPGNQIGDALSAILKPVLNEKISQKISEVHASFMGAYDLHQTAKSILLEYFQKPYEKVDWDLKIASQMRKLGFSYPHLIQFAETNWSGWFFGFVPNPFTGQTELWRLNRIGSQGFPMGQKWLSPNNDRPWIIFPRQAEYN